MDPELDHASLLGTLDGKGSITGPNELCMSSWVDLVSLVQLWLLTHAAAKACNYPWP